MNPRKAPGADGMTAGFFQDNWQAIRGDVVSMVQDFFNRGHMLRKLNHTHTVLIPKVGLPTRMSQLRPISLCNVAYKIISKNIMQSVKESSSQTD